MPMAYVRQESQACTDIIRTIDGKAFLMTGRLSFPSVSFPFSPQTVAINGTLMVRHRNSELVHELSRPVNTGILRLKKRRVGVGHSVIGRGQF